MKIHHRDGGYKLFSRICATISVFVYQGAVFYAQMVLADEIMDCTGTGCIVKDIVGVKTLWLLIETFCFYAYMIATTAYIAWMMLRGVCEKATPKSDMTKALNDFIGYASLNLTWFAFNFVLCFMPPVCIWMIQGPGLEFPNKTESYLPLMYTLWAMHCIAFVCKLRIYTIDVPKPKKVSSKDDEFAAADKIGAAVDKEGL